MDDRFHQPLLSPTDAWESSPLARRLLERHGAPLGVIDLRHSQVKAERLARRGVVQTELLDLLVGRYGIANEFSNNAGDLNYAAEGPAPEITTVSKAGQDWPAQRRPVPADPVQAESSTQFRVRRPSAVLRDRFSTNVPREQAGPATPTSLTRVEGPVVQQRRAPDRTARLGVVPSQADEDLVTALPNTTLALPRVQQDGAASRPDRILTDAGEHSAPHLPNDFLRFEDLAAKNPTPSREPAAPPAPDHGAGRAPLVLLRRGSPHAIESSHGNPRERSSTLNHETRSSHRPSDPLNYAETPDLLLHGIPEKLPGRNATNERQARPLHTRGPESGAITAQDRTEHWPIVSVPSLPVANRAAAAPTVWRKASDPRATATLPDFTGGVSFSVKSEASHGGTQGPPHPLATPTTQAATAGPAAVSSALSTPATKLTRVDLEQIAKQVTRIISRQLIIERERRGLKGWD
jgi:hypothetical protein